ncbi:MAG: DUF1425 domain-containing protein [Planctomycetes bacterium]|nr:DUF1425 domain-containing protein [Planctomycetota bacterium]
MKNLLLPFSLSLLPLVACTTAPSGSVVRYDGKGTEIGNSLLNAALEMRNIVRAEKHGLMVVQVDLKNRRTTPLAFQWSVEWYDRAGLKISYVPQHWEPERLAGSASKTIQMVAPSPEAVSWQLQVGSRDEIQ